MQQEKSAGAILYLPPTPRKYLLLEYHYKTTYWDFVKGHLEPGETPEQTVVRETEEETGLTGCKKIPEFVEKVSWIYRRESEMVQKHVTYFIYESKSDLVRLSHEHIGFGWFSFEEASQKITHKNSLALLKKAHEFLNKREKSSLHAFF